MPVRVLDTRTVKSVRVSSVMPSVRCLFFAFFLSVAQDGANSCRRDYTHETMDTSQYAASIMSRHRQRNLSTLTLYSNYDSNVELGNRQYGMWVSSHTSTLAKLRCLLYKSFSHSINNNTERDGEEGGRCHTTTRMQ